MRKKLALLLVAVLIMSMFVACSKPGNEVEDDVEQDVAEDVEQEDDVKADPDPMTFTDGVYEGSAKGFGGDIKVKVTVEDTKITDIEVLNMEETANIGDVAVDQVIEDIINFQSTEVDTVSGATVSSKATVEAVKNALDSDPAGDSEEDAEPVAYRDGTYEGTGKGFGGDIKVKVVVEDEKVASVEILEHSESAGISDPAINNIPDAIVSAGNPDVDNESGATVSSKGIKEAVKEALDQAK